MEARYRAEGGQRILLQGNEPLQFGPGEQIALSLAGRGDGFLAHTDPRHPFTNVVNGLVFNEGIDEARDTEPCRDRRNSKIGCAFSKVSKFNIGLGIVYFEDGTIWGNYGYGYAVPNPDGIYTRLEARGSRTDLDRTQAPN